MNSSLGKHLKVHWTKFCSIPVFVVLFFSLANGVYAEIGCEVASTMPGNYENPTNWSQMIGFLDAQKGNCYSFSPEGGFPPYTIVNVSGIGASIDGNGRICFSDTACGPFTITVTDSSNTESEVQGLVADGWPGLGPMEWSNGQTPETRKIVMGYYCTYQQAFDACGQWTSSGVMFIEAGIGTGWGTGWRFIAKSIAGAGGALEVQFWLYPVGH